MSHRLFTPSEANALLPQLREQLAKLRDTVNEIEKQQDELQRVKSAHAVTPYNMLDNDPFFVMESRIDFMRMEAQLLIDNFARSGVLLKMIDPGLLDFPAVIDGEDALICWKEGEESVTHYHGWHDGLAGRKRLPEQ
ncbi:DUF2203 domain-containing protein [Cohnella yongneupensis]|uniref:DUF2203 domain-containing protein n=1 Tax=Cohnella yongneupensis TaxID=425006 RepID=A0ABW0QZ14_9BACL